MMSTKKSVLGRGLSALLEDSTTDVTSKNDVMGAPALAGNIATISVDQIEANPFQPRSEFDAEALEELSASIKIHGIIQPVTVRKLGYDRYQLISGERRLKASRMAGLRIIPAYIRIANDQSMLEMALIENIQRENLNAIEISISYKRLLDECSITQEELSERLGKNRTTVTNYLRLLKLPPQIQVALRDNVITMGHARAIVSIDDPAKQLAIFKEIVDRQLNVRDVEELARINSTSSGKSVKKDSTALSFEYQKIQNVLSSHFSAKINLKRENNGKGKLVIPFENDEDLNRILELINY